MSDDEDNLIQHYNQFHPDQLVVIKQWVKDSSHTAKWYQNE